MFLSVKECSGHTQLHPASLVLVSSLSSTASLVTASMQQSIPLSGDLPQMLSCCYSQHALSCSSGCWLTQIKLELILLLSLILHSLDLVLLCIHLVDVHLSSRQLLSRLGLDVPAAQCPLSSALIAKRAHRLAGKTCQDCSLPLPHGSKVATQCQTGDTMTYLRQLQHGRCVWSRSHGPLSKVSALTYILQDERTEGSREPS